MRATSNPGMQSAAMYTRWHYVFEKQLRGTVDKNYSEEIKDKMHFKLEPIKFTLFPFISDLKFTSVFTCALTQRIGLPWRQV